jgi:hypothetical protein
MQKVGGNTSESYVYSRYTLQSIFIYLTSLPSDKQPYFLIERSFVLISGRRPVIRTEGFPALPQPLQAYAVIDLN